MPSKINIAVVDDQLLFRKGLISLFEDFNRFNIIIEAENGIDFFEKLNLQHPTQIDVLILDIEMPKMDGLEVLKILSEKHPNMKALVLTMHNEDALIFELVKLGAKGFLPKNADIYEVIDAIDTLHSDELCFNEDVSKVLVRKVASRNLTKLPHSLVRLSEREKEIVKLICIEKSTAEIASTLSISERTVNNHKTNIFAKTKAKNSAGIVMYALRTGLLDGGI
jgi:two-component system response regulator DegU